MGIYLWIGWGLVSVSGRHSVIW